MQSGDFKQVSYISFSVLTILTRKTLKYMTKSWSPMFHQMFKTKQDIRSCTRILVGDTNKEKTKCAATHHHGTHQQKVYRVEPKFLKT